MRTLLLAIGGLAAMGVGVAAGLVLGSGGAPGADELAPEPEVLLTSADGEERRLSLGEAAARIERLEALTDRRRERHTEPLAAEETDELEPMTGPTGWAGLRKADGSRYSLGELTEIITAGEDGQLVRAALRELRRHDSDAARQTLRDVLADPEADADLRLLAARMMARPPHRDPMTEELIAMLGEEDDPQIRLALAQGVTRLSERGAWMQEISALLGDETDAAVRAELLGGVARSSRDPAARAELLNLLDRPGVSNEERRRALDALDRGRPGPELRAKAEALLADADPALRRKAVAILTRERDMKLDTFVDALDDADPSVRAAALARGVRNLNRMRRSQDVDANARDQAIRDVAEMAGRDPDPGVRRVAVQNVWNLPRNMREGVLETGRADPDPRVRLAAYAASPEPVRRAATQEFVGGLESNDPDVRSAAYRQLSRLYQLEDVPYNGRWNDAARARAAREIRLRVTGSAQ